MAEGVGDELLELVHLEGLAEDEVDGRAVNVVLVDGRVPAGDEGDGGVWTDGSQLQGHFFAGHAWHVVVGEDEVEVLLLSQVDGFFTGSRADHFVAQFREHLAQDFADEAFVVDSEYARLAAPGLPEHLSWCGALRLCSKRDDDLDGGALAFLPIDCDVASVPSEDAVCEAEAKANTRCALGTKEWLEGSLECLVRYAFAVVLDDHRGRVVEPFGANRDGAAVAAGLERIGEDMAKGLAEVGRVATDGKGLGRFVGDIDVDRVGAHAFRRARLHEADRTVDGLLDVQRLEPQVHAHTRELLHLLDGLSASDRALLDHFQQVVLTVVVDLSE